MPSASVMDSARQAFASVFEGLHERVKLLEQERDTLRKTVRGAEARARDSNGSEPLHQAAAFGQLSVAVFLVGEAGADAAALGSAGSRPLRASGFGGGRVIFPCFYLACTVR